MMKFSLLISIHVDLFCTIAYARSTAPLSVAWSTRSFGPDGPWSAVEVTIGSDSQSLNLYPGGSFASNILNISSCISSTCYAKNAGSVFNSNKSITFVNGEVSFAPSPDFSNGVLDITTTTTTGVVSCDDWDVQIAGGASASVQNVDMALWDSLSATLPDGTQYPIEMGNLALGGGQNAVNQSFSEDSGSPLNYSLITGTLWSTKVIPSNAWGMHIGSVEPPVAPSLILGGYDQTHILSPVSTQPNGPGTIPLLDIELNVIQGASPFRGNFTSLSGLLADNNETTAKAGSLNVDINPLAPYLSLPQNTCDAIAAQLPVTFQAKYGLYFWNTTDPLYKTIVSSASALSFIFRANNSNTQNITINVPFLLLNLTLTEPIIAEDTLYFPCFAEKTGSKYNLGRAFLQAAFIGAHWGSNVWWLAQAPGPNVADVPAVMTINQEDTSISPSDSSWNVSWSRNWVVLEDNSNGTPTGTLAAATSIATSTTPSPSTHTTTTSSSSSSISTGAKAGIGAGIGAAVLAAIIGTGLYFFRRHRERSRQSINDSTAGIPMMPITGNGYQYHNANGNNAPITEYYKPEELGGREAGRAELNGEEEVHRAEINGREMHRAELDG